MEKKIKALYILSIIAILAFLGMQAYWLYSRYEYSIDEYEARTQEIIGQVLAEYDKLRTAPSPETKEIATARTVHSLYTDVDSSGQRTLIATVTEMVFGGSEFPGFDRERRFTQEEIVRLASAVDSIGGVKGRKASFKVTNAPSDGAVWNGMKKVELEMQSPFTVEGLDSLLRKENIDADVSLTVTDSIRWEATVTSHRLIINPRFTIESPYSELERKSVVIGCRIPVSEVLREMGGTLGLAIVISLFLITCLIWQIKTIVRLTRLDKMRNMFITTMIHELKRPISTLKMCISGIESDKLMEDSVLRKELTGECRIALDNLSAYFSRLRDLTFNNVDEIPLNLASFNLSDLTGSILRSIAIPVEKKVVFENNIPADMQISADRSLMSSIITNLVENAVKYSGSEVTVKIGAAATDNGVKIDVSDNGNGISSADIPEIFNRFYRGKASGTDIPGMGLGLTYVKLLIDAHCGEISVDSTPGVGSTFTIRLPQ